MPAFDYSIEYKVWIKQCTKCLTVYKGTAEEEESIKIIGKVFASGGGYGDGFATACRECQRFIAYRSRYGLERAEVEEMIKVQNGKCYLCKLEGDCLDHDHSSGAIRKFLCYSCNNRMHLVDGDRYDEVWDKEWLTKAIQYKNDHYICRDRQSSNPTDHIRWKDDGIFA